ncbi:hypothetical protein RHSP_62606 [Rhizobium freirei PRF 81]|uniref:Uncharacterized protein n=1 Tax=Rhizobium freirei PRF 81 TaxID=363754 RepID=N6V5R8_9HYPH|nr:hypothetical protein RHSP_62606 [Rhizobium freirei PRF 81]
MPDSMTVVWRNRLFDVHSLGRGFLGHQACKIEQFRVKQMRWIHMRQRAQHRILAAWHAPLDIRKHVLHGIALQPVLRATEIAGNDRKLHGGSEFGKIVFRRIGERTQQHQVALVIEKLRRHGSQPAAMEEVHEEGFENILAMMAEHQRVAAFFAGDAIEIAAAQARTERAIGCPLRHFLLHDRIGIAILNTMRDTNLRQIFRQNMLRKIRLALIEIAGNQFDGQQPAPFEIEQQRQQTIGILAAGEPDEPALLALQHLEIVHCLAHLPQQALAKLVEGDGSRRIGKHRMRGRATIFSLDIDFIFHRRRDIHSVIPCMSSR